MSLFDDKNLINQLLKIAQDPASAKPDAPAYDPRFFEITNKMFANNQTIQKFLNPEKQQGITADKDIYLKDINIFKKLDNLFKYLSENMVKYNSYQIVLIPSNATPKAPQSYLPFPKAETEDPVKYFVYKDGIIAFLKSLEDNANKITKPLIESLKSKINDDLVAIPSSSQPGQATPGTPGEQAQSGNQGTKITQQQVAKIQSIIWPLTSDSVNINELKKFFDWYIGFKESGDHESPEAGIFKQIRSKIEKFSMDYPSFPTVSIKNAHFADFQKQFDAMGNTKRVADFISELQSFIEFAKSALTELNVIFEQNMPSFVPKINDQLNIVRDNEISLYNLAH